MTMSSIGLPALNGFIGEILILQGVFVVNKMWAAVAASGIVLGAAYMLWLYQRTMFGKVENPKNEHLKDLNLREFATFAPLIILALWIGLYPAPLLNRLTTSVDRVVSRVNAAYAPKNAQGGAADTTDCGQTSAAEAQAATGNPFVAAAPCGDTAATTPAQAANKPEKGVR
jgi:NADH-quinone oxidoreductase subunit M